MFHGNKKKEDKKALTEEEIQKMELQLHKIKTIQKEILDRSAKNDLDEKNLDFLIKAAQIMPDFYSLWNYRKKVILELRKIRSNEDFLTFVKNELLQTANLQRGSPKSYVLWYHRIWMLKLTSEIEREIKTPLENSFLTQEINNINYFLDKDDRNFHVWNHRSTIFSLIREHFPDNFRDFLSKELEFTITMIKKNCSNFSAWHYRSKLIPLYFNLNNKHWNTEETVNFFKLDLELITNAVYTDPKDQSPWNYHLWIVNNLTPIHVQFFEVDTSDNSVKIKLSDIVKCKELFLVENENGEKLNLDSYISTENENDYSDCIVIRLPENENIHKKIRIFGDESKLNSDKICFSRNNLSLPEIWVSFESSEIQVKVNTSNFLEHHRNFLESQLKIIEDLISNSDSGFLEFAHYRKAQIQTILFYHNSETDLQKVFKKEINEGYSLLRKNSKRMKTMYEEMMMRLMI